MILCDVTFADEGLQNVCLYMLDILVWLLGNAVAIYMYKGGALLAFVLYFKLQETKIWIDSYVN